MHELVLLQVETREQVVFPLLRTYPERQLEQMKAEERETQAIGI